MALKYHLLLNEPRILLGSILSILMLISGFYLAWNYIAPENYSRPTPLHTNVYFGVDSVGVWTSLYWYIGILFILSLIHIIGSLYLFNHSCRRALTWLYLGVLAQSLLLYMFWRVLHLA